MFIYWAQQVSLLTENYSVCYVQVHIPGKMQKYILNNTVILTGELSQH
jgi:hypothetical protein